MNRCFGMLFVVLAGVVLVHAPQTWGQEPGDAEAQAVIDLQFSGGTIAEYVAAIRDAAGDVNIVLATPEVRDIPLPPIELQSVAINSAIQLVAGEMQANNRTPLNVYVEELDPKDDRARPIFRVSAYRRGPAPKKRSRDVRVWTLADLLNIDPSEVRCPHCGYDDELEGKAILTAVETAVGLLDEKLQPAEIRYHEATTLLVASGDKQQLAAIRSVVQGLRQGIALQREAAKDTCEGSLEQAERQTRELEAQLQEKTKLLEGLQPDQKAALKDRQRLSGEVDALRYELWLKENRIKSLERKLSERSEK